MTPSLVKFDCGSRIAGTKITHTFIVRNVGKYALRIDRLPGSCECISGKLIGTKPLTLPCEINPGELIRLLVTIDTPTLSDAHFRRYLAIFTNSNKWPSETIEIWANLAGK